MLVLGSGSGKVRDAAPAAFLVGHSVGYWVLHDSPLPVYLMREGLLAQQSVKRYTPKPRLFVSQQPGVGSPLASAAA